LIPILEADKGYDSMDPRYRRLKHKIFSFIPYRRMGTAKNAENQKLKAIIGELILELKKPKKSCYEKKNLKHCDQEKQAYFEANRKT
jgi:hypothetical protein